MEGNEFCQNRDYLQGGVNSDFGHTHLNLWLGLGNWGNQVKETKNSFYHCRKKNCIMWKQCN